MSISERLIRLLSESNDLKLLQSKEYDPRLPFVLMEMRPQDRIELIGTFAGGVCAARRVLLGQSLDRT